ncbi:GNAT family N-acetyltransferase [Cytobacillus spongiae]|jgi:ribosomal protein S18 acetylase RimI-like enzyme|uniref:GNAT family N-acetyltransferase n=1 Tax=Cytobacillus spongiae TaxID=2901381 RepID=UPI001F4107D8|nr:GNAT family N-acetyltransferase [Cytobacillus spongiae]UII54197.1 GNAT family N-acetyltransferase [Cytobacillus spongiae]
MNIQAIPIEYKEMPYMIRSAEIQDALELSQVRLLIDGETEYLDRESGEAYLDEGAFVRLIQDDSANPTNLFLVVEVNKRIVGFSRCEGNRLKRTSHRVTFGVCVLKEFWGYGMGKNLLKASLQWADDNQIRKVSLEVLETNTKAIKLYQDFGFEIEGTLKNDKLLSDGKFYHTVVMGRIR